MQKPKSTWDTRAWLVGILGGTIGGSLAAWTTYPPIKARLIVLPPAFGVSTADLLPAASGLLTSLVLPGLLSGLARRRTFFWGLLPLGLFLVSVDLEEWAENGIKSVLNEWWIGTASVGIVWIIASGPVSLIRWLRVRAARRHAALLASYQVHREVSGPQEGVWPPPPEYRE